MNDHDYITPLAASKRLGVSTRTLRRWMERGLITGLVLPSGQRRYSFASVVLLQSKLEKNGNEN